MIRTGRRRLALGAIVMTLVLVQGVPVSANMLVWSDRDDTRSPLDLRRLRVTHAAIADVFRFATYEGFRDGRIDGERGWFRVGFAGGDGWRRSVYVFTVEGELRGVVTDADGGFLRFARARRIARGRVEVRVPHAVTGSAPYRFAVWSVWNRAPCSRTTPCVDWVPDAGTIRHA